MEIKNIHLQEALRAMAAVHGKEYVGMRIAEEAIAIGCSSLLQAPDEPGALHNNQQRIFRWLECETPAQRKKIKELLPAILKALPGDIRARLSIYDTIERRALLAAQEALRVAIDAHDDAINAIYDEARGAQPAQVYH